MTFKKYYSLMEEGKHRSKFMEEIGFTKHTPDFLEDDVDSENEYSLVTPDYNVHVTLSKTSKDWTASTQIQFLLKDAVPNKEYISELDSHFLRFLRTFDLRGTFSYIDDPSYEVYITNSNELDIRIWGDAKGRTLDDLQKELNPIQHNLQWFKKRHLDKELKNFLSHYEISNDRSNELI